MVEMPAPPKGMPFPLQVGLVFFAIFMIAVSIGLAWPSIRSVATTLAARQNCTIKGNISEHGVIYHMPGDEHYAETRIDTQRGERWFCTEAEARTEGWRRAMR